MPKTPRYTIVRTHAGFHVRLIGGNYARVVWSEPYPRVARARRAIELSCLAAGATPAKATRVGKDAPVLDER